MDDVTRKEYFDNPKLFSEMTTGSDDCVTFDNIIQSISTEYSIANAKDLFSYYDVLFPQSMSRYPRYVYNRFSGGYGSNEEKIAEIENLAKCGIVKKEEYFVTDPPDSFSSLPSALTREMITSESTDQTELLKSIEACVSRRNAKRMSLNYPNYIVSRGKVVYDEVPIVLQILRAKMICHVA